MPSFTIYLIKENFKHCERYEFKNNSVSENEDSLFNVGVTSQKNQHIKQYFFTKDIKSRILTKSKSPNNVYYRETNDKNPWWCDFWDIPEELENRSNDILVVKSINNRIFIIVHGQGRYLINPLAIEYDFGIRTALNLIDEKKLKSADIFTPSEIAMRTRKQPGRSTNIEQYDIDVYSTLLKNIAGAVQKDYSDYFTNVNGADSIKFNFKGEPAKLYQIIEDLLKHYSTQEYQKKGFDWIDNYRIVKDKSITQKLNDKLLELINSYSDDIILSYPQIIDPLLNVYFRYNGIKKGKHDISFVPVLDIESQYYNQFKKSNISLTFDDLKKQHIAAFDHDSGYVLGSYSIFQCIYCEIIFDNSQYILESGSWYKVDKNFIKNIKNKIDHLLNSALNLPITYDWQQITQEAAKQKKNNEFIFNNQVNDYLNNNGISELLDTKLVHLGTSKIEVCDVLYKDQSGGIKLFHNKYKYGASALSHLFSQGNTSARLLTEIDFRKKANSIITNKKLFLIENGFSRENCTIVFGIISKKNKTNSFTLPLFSQINLEHFYRNLTTLGYKTQLCFFEIK